jgi:3-oxoacyl-[acyl-carrier-protein] synthase-3
MGQNGFKGIRISGMASVVPSGIKSVEEEESLRGMDRLRLNRLKRDIGLNKKHVCLKGECASDLCERAARILLSRLGYDPSTIDCLFMATSTPDYFQPATGCVLHGRLGLRKDCAAFDVNLACSAYVYGLWLSSMMIATGSCERVLMLVGDTISRCVSPYDRAVAPLFGDGGSATMVEKGEEGEIITFALHSDGSCYDNLLIPAGAFRKRPSAETAKIIEREDGNARSEEHLYMNGAEIFSFSIEEIPAVVEEVLQASNWGKEEVDYFIFHQANKFIIRNIARKLNIPSEKAPCDVFEKYGNQSSASIPVTVCENLSSILGNRSIKVVLSAFGAGLSWAACALSLGPMNCSPVMILDE